MAHGLKLLDAVWCPWQAVVAEDVAGSSPEGADLWSWVSMSQHESSWVIFFDVRAQSWQSPHIAAYAVPYVFISLSRKLSHSWCLCLARRSLSRAVPGPSFTFAGRKAWGKLSMHIFFARLFVCGLLLLSCCTVVVLDTFAHSSLLLLAFRLWTDRLQHCKRSHLRSRWWARCGCVQHWVENLAFEIEHRNCFHPKDAVRWITFYVCNTGCGWASWSFS